MSLWVFALLVKVLGIATPVGFGQAIAGMNIAALVLLGVLAWKAAPWGGIATEDWLWVGALAASNPVAIWLHRTVWAQSVTPLFLLLFWCGFFQRRKWWGALLWGVVGMCLGQIHMVGFVLFFSILLLAVLLRRRESTHWWGLAVGILAAGWPLIPWATEVAGGKYQAAARVFGGLPGKAWIWWFLSDTGLGSSYLFSNRMLPSSFAGFLRQPVVGGISTWGVALLHAALELVVFVSLGCWTIARLRERDVRQLLTKETDDATYVVRMLLAGFCVLLTLMPAPVFVHYFLLVFPMGFLWVSWMVGRCSLWKGKGPVALSLMVALQLLLSVTLAAYVHQNAANGGNRFGIH